MSDKIHIVFVLGDYPKAPNSNLQCGGIAVITRNIALQLLKHNFEVSVIGMVNIKENECEFNDDGINVYLFKNGHYFYATNMVERLLVKIDSKCKIDIVEITDSRPIISKYLPYVTCLRLHNSLALCKYNSGVINSEKDLKNINERFYFYSLNLVDSVTGVSTTIINDTINFHNLNSKLVYGTIYNGLDTININKVLDLPNTSVDINNANEITIFCHGTLGIMKGQVELCKIFSTLYQLDKRFKLVLIGRGEDYFRNNCIPVLGESIQNVTYYNNMAHQEVIELISNYDIYISLSKSESFGLATLEAMLLGKVSIVSDIPIYNELLSNNEDCILVNPQNTEEIVRQITEITSNSERYNSLKTNAIKKANKYTLDVTVSESVLWYRHLVANKTELMKNRDYPFESWVKKYFFNFPIKFYTIFIFLAKKVYIRVKKMLK